MKITFINVGYGEAIYIECPDESRPGGQFTMLIDGGSGEAAEYEASSTGRIPAAEYLRRTGKPTLDVMVNTHIHEDHLCGLLPVAKAQPPRAFWQSFDPAISLPQLAPAGEGANASRRKFITALRDYGSLRALFAKSGCSVRQLRAGETISLCPGLTMQVLGPHGEKVSELERRLAELSEVSGETLEQRLGELDAMLNNFSLVLLLEYCGTRILLPGDTNDLGYEELPEADLRANLFKVGHHGQRDGVNEALLQRIGPAHVVCCASSDRRYQSAAPAVLDLVANYGAAMHFSDCPLETVPPHESLVFSVGTDGSVRADYMPEPAAAAK